MFLHIERVVYLHDYLLRLTFNNGATHIVNLEPELYGEVFAPLRDQAEFCRVYVNPETRTIEWPNGADFAPEFLYELAHSGTQQATAPSAARVVETV